MRPRRGTTSEAAAPPSLRQDARTPTQERLRANLFACSFGRMLTWVRQACAEGGSRSSRSCRATTRAGPSGWSACLACARSSHGMPSSSCGSHGGDQAARRLGAIGKGQARRSCGDSDCSPRSRIRRTRISPVQRACRAGHQVGPHRRPGGLPGARLSPVGCRRPSGLQNQAYGSSSPLARSTFCCRPGHAGVGRPAPLVDRRLRGRPDGNVVADRGLWGHQSVGATHQRDRLCRIPRLVAEVAVTSVEVWPRLLRGYSAAADHRPIDELASQPVRLGVPLGWSGECRCQLGHPGPADPLAADRRWDGTHLRLSLAGAASIVAVSMWWIIPLVLLGRFSPPFLSWIENASVTTSTASVFEAIRGTSAWLSFLLTDTGPSWPAAWLQITVPAIGLAAVLVAAIGVLGMTGAGGTRLPPSGYRRGACSRPSATLAAGPGRGRRGRRPCSMALSRRSATHV